MIVFIFINYTYFLSNRQSILLANFTLLKQKAGDAAEKDSKILILGVSRTIIYLLIYLKFIEIFQKTKKQGGFLNGK